MALEAQRHRSCESKGGRPGEWNTNNIYTQVNVAGWCEMEKDHVRSELEAAYWLTGWVSSSHHQKRSSLKVMFHSPCRSIKAPNRRATRCVWENARASKGNKNGDLWNSCPFVHKRLSVSKPARGWKGQSAPSWIVLIWLMSECCEWWSKRQKNAVDRIPPETLFANQVHLFTVEWRPSDQLCSCPSCNKSRIYRSDYWRPQTRSIGIATLKGIYYVHLNRWK